MKYKTVAETFGVDPNSKDLSDCWLLSNDKPQANPYTKEIMLDYEKMKLRLITERYSVDLAIKKGQYILKDVIQQYLSYYSIQTHMFMDNANTKCFPVLQAIIESDLHIDTMPEQITDLRNTLRKTHIILCDKIGKALLSDTGNS